MIEDFLVKRFQFSHCVCELKYCSSASGWRLHSEVTRVQFPRLKGFCFQTTTNRSFYLHEKPIESKKTLKTNNFRKFWFLVQHKRLHRQQNQSHGSRQQNAVIIWAITGKQLVWTPTDMSDLLNIFVALCPSSSSRLQGQRRIRFSAEPLNPSLWKEDTA